MSSTAPTPFNDMEYLLNTDQSEDGLSKLILNQVHSTSYGLNDWIAAPPGSFLSFQLDSRFSGKGRKGIKLIVMYVIITAACSTPLF